MKVAFFFFPPWDPQYPSHAMGLFRSSTKAAGHEFIGYDLNVDLFNAVPRSDRPLWDASVAARWSADQAKVILRYADYYDARVRDVLKNQIGLYAMSINGYSKHSALHVAKKIREQHPSASILLGGPQCFPAYDGVRLLENEYVDAICTGEGDRVWPRVLEHLAREGNLQVDIPGIAYRRTDGKIVDNGKPELVKDLNAIPYADYSDVDFRKYGNRYHLSTMTSRGCVNTCAFCSERPNFSRYRFRTADNVYGEIAKHLEDLRSNHSVPKGKKIHPYVSFTDSMINGHPRELERFCDLVVGGGLKFLWGGMALIRKELTRDLLFKMRRAGCNNLAWGLEAGCQEVLDLMHKKFFDIPLARQVIRLAAEAGIQQSISLIAGFPGETEEMFLETKAFALEHKRYCSSIGIQPMMIVKNSLVHDKPEDFGVAAGSDWLKWETLDGTNTYDVRLKRVETLKSALNGDILTIEKGDSTASDGSSGPLEPLSVLRLRLRAMARMCKRTVGSHLSIYSKDRIRAAFRLFGIRI